MTLPHALALRTVIVATVLSVAAGTGAAVDATWKTHQDGNCGVEVKYPGTYSLEASGAADSCALWIRVGLKQARGLRALFSLETREMESSLRPPLSPLDFALQVAAAQCMADGPDGSTYCTDVGVRSTFKTAQGFQAFEIRLTEVRETVSPAKIEKRKRDPVFALDLSDDQTVRVLMAAAEPQHLGELRAILDTLRVWTRARRSTPRVVEMDPFRGGPQAFVLRLATVEQPRENRWPPSPVTSWLLTDPRGRRLGRDPVTGAWYSESPAVTHSTAVESGFMLRETVEGHYSLQVTASVPSVAYQLAVRAPDQAGKPATVRHGGRTAQPGAADRYDIVYSQGSAPAVTIAEVGDSWRFGILLSSRGDVVSELTLTDPLGHKTGLDPVGKVEHRAIPRASYAETGTSPRAVLLDARQPMDGTYVLQVTGTAPGSYTLDLRAWDRTGTTSTRPMLPDVPTGPGVVHIYRLDYESTARAPLKLSGRFEGDRLLAYGNYAGSEAKLSAGATSFPLVIFYGAGIKPMTFNALLNGNNVSGRFTPEPEGYQIVRIPMASGPNTLVLSVEGTTAGGQAITDTQRLVFRVE